MLSTHDAADAVLAHRPSWDRDKTSICIGKLRHIDPRIDAVKVALRAAKDPSARTPEAILFDKYRANPADAFINALANKAEQFAARRALDEARANAPTAQRRAEIRAAGPITFTGPNCWRHDDQPVIDPYDECAACLDERHTANEWREANGRPIQPPHHTANAK